MPRTVALVIALLTFASAPALADCSPSGVCCAHWTAGGTCAHEYPCAHCNQDDVPVADAAPADRPRICTVYVTQRQCQSQSPRCLWPISPETGSPACCAAAHYPAACLGE